MLREMFLLLFGSIPIFAAVNPSGFTMTCLGAAVLAAALWWFCSLYTRLWNLSFYLNWFHLTLCGLAAVWTVFFVIAFVSVGEIGYEFDRVVTDWGIQMHSLSSNVDGELSSLNAFDLQQQFESTHPFLRDVVKSAQTAADEFTGTPDADLPDSGAGAQSDGETVDQAVDDLKHTLQFHVHWAVYRLRAYLLFSFLLVQGFVFALTGYAAHREICPSV